MKKRSNLKHLFIFNGLLLIVAFAIIQYSVVKNKSHINELIIHPVLEGEFGKRITIFDPLLDFQNIHFKTVFDKSMSLQDYKGQWIILNFWATWCPPCIVEMPSLQKMQDIYYTKNLKVIAISLDRNMTGKRLKEFMAKHQFGAVAGFYSDFQGIKNKIKVEGLPTTYILSPNGQAIGLYTGEENWASNDVRKFIDSLLRAN